MKGGRCDFPTNIGTLDNIIGNLLPRGYWAKYEYLNLFNF